MAVRFSGPIDPYPGTRRQCGSSDEALLKQLCLVDQNVALCSVHIQNWTFILAQLPLCFEDHPTDCLN